METKKIDYKYTNNTILVKSGVTIETKDNITCLPDNLVIDGDLNASFMGINNLPENLSVDGNLYLNNTEITDLPSDLKIGGKIIMPY